MKLADAISARRSVRQFKSDDVGEEVVKKIILAGIAAPSAGNGQSWHFFVVRDEKARHALAVDAGHQHFIHQAPVVIVVCADLDRAERNYGSRGREVYALQETAAAVENMLLTIASEGLGSCWIGAFDEKKASEILKLPKNIRPLAMLPVGVPNEPPKKTTPRRKFEEVVSYV